MSRQRWNDIFEKLGVTPPDQIDPLKDVDIQKEYNLIVIKKSTLSANKRAIVVNRMKNITSEINELAKERDIPDNELENFIAENMEISIEEHNKLMGDCL